MELGAPCNRPGNLMSWSWEFHVMEQLPPSDTLWRDLRVALTSSLERGVISAESATLGELLTQKSTRKMKNPASRPTCGRSYARISDSNSIEQQKTTSFWRNGGTPVESVVLVGAAVCSVVSAVLRDREVTRGRESQLHGCSARPQGSRDHCPLSPPPLCPSCVDRGRLPSPTHGSVH